jgi:predicted Rossmann fold nucleotide-binding protein DprA/Smf involved in DNA uptake
MFALGDEALLRGPKLGLFCSRNCPDDLKLKSLVLMRRLRAAGVTVISGFQGPVGRESLRTLSAGLQPIIICPARSLEGMPVPKDYQRPIAKGRLLLLSMFASHCQQTDRSLVLIRNAFVAGLAEALLFIHAAPGSRTETMLPKLGFIGKPTFCLDSPSNNGIVEQGARPITADFTDWFVGSN